MHVYVHECVFVVVVGGGGGGGGVVVVVKNTYLLFIWRIFTCDIP